MNLKIGRYEYTITSKDEFIDNGICVQLLTQSKEKSTWGRRPNPILSKRAIKQINEFTRIQHKHSYMNDTQVFALNI